MEPEAKRRQTRLDPAAAQRKTRAHGPEAAAEPQSAEQAVKPAEPVAEPAAEQPKPQPRRSRRPKITRGDVGTIPRGYTEDEAREWIHSHSLAQWKAMGQPKRKAALEELRHG